MKQRTGWVMVLACGIGVFASGAAAAQAEYAIRWDPSQGGPKTAAEALARLAPGDNDIETDLFRVRYASEVKTPTDVVGARAILRERERTSKARHELTYKLRSNSPLPSVPSFAGAQCPAGPLVGPKDETKDEIDVSFTGAADPVRAFSRSCTVQSTSAPPPVPEALQTRFAACESTTTRLGLKQRGNLRVEEWRLPGGRIAIEASRTGPDTPKALKAFRREVVEPLTTGSNAIRPLSRSKTDLGSDCGA